MYFIPRAHMGEFVRQGRRRTKRKEKKDKKTTTTGNLTERVEIRNRKTLLAEGGEGVAIF